MFDRKINIGGEQFVLTAAVQHDGGTPQSGHYKAHVMDSSSGIWITCNDESIHSTTANSIEANKNISLCILSKENVWNLSKVSSSQIREPPSSPTASAAKVKRNRLTRTGTVTDKTRVTNSAEYGNVTVDRSSRYMPYEKSNKFTKPSPKVIIA